MGVTQFIEAVAILVCLGLMAGTMLTFTLGRRAGIRHRQKDPEGARSVSGAVEAVARGVPGAVPVLIPAINQMFDVATMRKMALLTHPPLPIYALMMILALVCSTLAGHHAAPSARHPLVLPLMFAGISSLAIFVILDLEYPRAGFIRIDSADILLRQLREHMS